MIINVRYSNIRAISGVVPEGGNHHKTTTMYREGENYKQNIRVTQEENFEAGSRILRNRSFIE